jgi:hypothetical protein
MRKILLILFRYPFIASAQPKFQITGIPVTKNGRTLQNPWVGGLNNRFSP